MKGLDKIKSADKARDFEWDNQEIKAFVEDGCNGWSQKEKDKLIRLGCTSKCPSFLDSILITCPIGLPVDSTHLETAASRFEEAWGEFSCAGLSKSVLCYNIPLKYLKQKLWKRAKMFEGLVPRRASFWSS